MAKKEKIVLCMIVKDEEQVILRAFDSVKDIVDYYVICDTGSTDNTIQVMKDYWKKNKLKGEVHENPWVDYSHNRQIAFDIGCKKGDYMMTLDADEVFAPLGVSGPDLTKKVKTLPRLNVDRVDVPTHFGNTIYLRSQFFKTSKKWIWASPCHEVCISNDPSITSDTLKGVCVYPTSEGARAKDPKRFLRDALIFERELIDNPDDVRSWFYLAQSYRDGGKPKAAIEPLKKCIEISSWPEEKAVCYLRLARFTKEVGGSFDDVLHWYWKAYETCPHVGEALFDMLQYYRLNGNYNCGVVVGEIFINNNVGPGVLFADKIIYEWGWKDELSICYHYVGKYQEALDLIDSIMDCPSISEGDRQRIINNRVYSQDAIDVK